MQAIYSDENIGHFGLNLPRYAHFTSPIRRYADLIVHRALIRALGLGDDGLTEKDLAQIKTTAESITFAERRAMAAERDAMNRYIAAFLADQVGAEFVRLAETGADGLVPVSSLGGEYFIHDDRAHTLVGERTGVRWPLGMTVQVRLTEATPVTGGLLFEMLSDPAPPDPSAPRPRLGLRARNDRRPGGPGKPGRPSGVRTGRKQKMGGGKKRGR
jgi:ribonuclease R